MFNSLLTSTGYFHFLLAMKRFTMLSVLCINSLMWLRTVAQCDCCRIQLPRLSGDWNHWGTQFRTRTKRSFWLDSNNFKAQLQTFCRGYWVSSQRRIISSAAEQRARQGAELQLRFPVLGTSVGKGTLVWACWERGRPRSINLWRRAALSFPASVSIAEHYRVARLLQI